MLSTCPFPSCFFPFQGTSLFHRVNELAGECSSSSSFCYWVGPGSPDQGPRIWPWLWIFIFFVFPKMSFEPCARAWRHQRSVYNAYLQRENWYSCGVRKFCRMNHVPALRSQTQSKIYKVRRGRSGTEQPCLWVLPVSTSSVGQRSADCHRTPVSRIYWRRSPNNRYCVSE